MSKGLTRRQATILDFIVETIHVQGIPPSIREIGNAFGIGSLRGVTVHLEALEAKAFIRRELSMPRGIIVLRNAQGEAVQLRHVTKAVAASIEERNAGSWTVTSSGPTEVRLTFEHKESA